MALYHVFSEVENAQTGVPMPGVQVVARFAGTQVVAPIYANKNGDPFEPANCCVTDASGMYSFYIDPAEYDLDYKVGSQVIRTIESYKPAEIGPVGPANSTYTTTEALEESDVANISAILSEAGKAGTFTIRDYVDFTAEVATDAGKVNYIRSTSDDTKVWVRTSILSDQAAKIGTAGGSTVEAELAANAAAIQTVSDATAAKASASALGVLAGDADMGAFAGAVIPDGSTAKQALQALETALETIPSAATKVNATAVGIPATDANMGTTPGTILSDNGTAKQWFQESEAAIEVGGLFQQAGLGAVVRTGRDKARETVSVKDFGAIGDGVTRTVAQWIVPGALGRYVSLAALQVDYPHVTATTDNLEWAAWQAGVNALMSSGGGRLGVPDGIYNISGTITQDRSSNTSLGVVDIIGDGRKSVRINHTGGTPLFQVTGHATIGEQMTKDIKLSGMTLVGNGETGQIGLAFTLASFPHFTDMEIAGFDYAGYFQDCDHAAFVAVIMRWNSRGLFCRQNPAPTSNSTQPNQFTFVECTIGNNGLFGMHNSGGSTWTFTGCSIENNGYLDDVSGFGVQFQDCGYQGGAICSFNGTYFESNNGLADVILIQTSASPLVDATYNFNGCVFNRASPTNAAVNNILMNFDSVANVGDQVLNLNGCTFKSFNSYVPSGATPYLNWVGVQTASHINFNAPGTIFEDAVEAPPKVQRIGKPFAQFGKAGNQTINNASATVWAIDTTSFNYSSVGTINGSNQVVITEAGNYAISANLVFTGVLTGTGFVEIRKNAANVARPTQTGTDVYSASAIVYLAAGDLIDVRVLQNSGGSALLANSGIANSFLNIQKLADG